MTEIEAPLNGVDLALVREITDRYRANPEEGQTAFEASVTWLGGYRTEAQLGSFAGVRGDEPPALAGTGTGPAPEELLLGAVSQCLIVGIAGSASARRIRIDALAVHSEGVVNLPAAYGVDDGSPGFREIRVTVRLEADAERTALEELVAKAVALAPIPNTVSRPVPVTVSLG